MCQRIKHVLQQHFTVCCSLFLNCLNYRVQNRSNCRKLKQASYLGWPHFKQIPKQPGNFSDTKLKKCDTSTVWLSLPLDHFTVTVVATLPDLIKPVNSVVWIKPGSAFQGEE